MKIGHGYWRTVALNVPAHGLLPPVTVIVQRCEECGKFRTVRLPGNWEDYADGFYDEGYRKERA